MRLISDPVLIRGHVPGRAKPFGEYRHRGRVKHHVVLAERHAAYGVTAAIAQL